MLPLITYLLIFFFSLYGIIILIELLKFKAVKKTILEFIPLFVAWGVLYQLADFPTPKKPFGDVSPFTSISLMFISIILGMIAQNFYYQNGEFNWRSIFKAICVSPIVLLPLIGIGTSDLEPIQIVFLCVLSFQNGFFWKVIFEDVEKKMQRS